MASCAQAVVTIQKVKVTKSESYGDFIGFTGEPGSSAEWDLQFTVAGQTERIRFDNVRDGSELVVNRSFLVDLGPLESLDIGVSGVEVDDSSANDTMPRAEYKITPASNWSEGQSFERSAASHPDFGYSVVFDIRCAYGKITSPLTGNAPAANVRYDGIWVPATDGRPIVWGWTFEDFNKKNGECYSQGYRLTHQQRYDIGGGQIRYDGIWTRANDGRPIVWGSTFEDFNKKNGEFYAQGYRLTHQQRYDIGGGQIRYDGIWTPGNDGRPIVWGWAFEDFNKKNGECYAQGYRLTHQQRYDIGGGQIRYDGIWTPGNDGRPIVWGWAFEDFNKKNGECYAQRYRLTHQQRYDIGGGQIRYDGIWTPGNDGRPIVWGWAFEDFQKKNGECYSQGYRLMHQQRYNIN